MQACTLVARTEAQEWLAALRQIEMLEAASDDSDEEGSGEEGAEPPAEAAAPGKEAPEGEDEPAGKALG